MGPVSKSLTRDEEGDREYKVKWLVRTDALRDGPGQVIRCPGLPRVGSFYFLGNDIDVWAWCRPNAQVRVHQEKEGDATKFWTVEQTFSTKPIPPGGKAQRCHDAEVEDPLLEPQKLSGSFSRFTEEATHDRFGNPITTSSWEQIRGQQNEWDANRPGVVVEQNVADLQLPLLTRMVDTLNDRFMWGLPARCIKMSEPSWEKRYHGQCYVYFTRKLQFEARYRTLINPQTGATEIVGAWDRDILDEGTKVLNGHWDPLTGEYALDAINGQTPSRFNPNHFMRFQDRVGNVSRVVLNGAGMPALAVVAGTRSALNVTIASAGSGYSVGDYVVLSGGTTTSTGMYVTLQVQTVTSSGGLAQVKIVVAGGYSSIPSNPAASTTTGLGTGGSFNVTWQNVGGYRTQVGHIHVEKYSESNFFLLGVPATLEY